MEDLQDDLTKIETLELVKMAQVAFRQSTHPNAEVRTAAQQLREDIESEMTRRVNA